MHVSYWRVCDATLENEDDDDNDDGDDDDDDVYVHVMEPSVQFSSVSNA